MNNIIAEVRQQLIRNIDQKTKETGQNFFKEKVTYYGCKTGFVAKLAKATFTAIQEKPKTEIFALCEALWLSGYMEESWIACNWSYFVQEHYQPADFQVFERWLNKYVTNWASCDTLCNHSVGALVEKYPQFLSELKKWTHSSNRWVRRASAVTLIIPARKGLFLEDIFEIADSLLLDQDDLVQKGYGWMLKAASEAHQQQVFDYVMKNKAVMPRTSLRYAIEKMPKELKVKAMAK